MRDSPLRAAIYCRASTLREEQDSTIPNQEAIGRDYAARRGWTVVTDAVYTDRFTGTKLDRRGFQQAVSEMRAGRFDVLIAKDLERFSRNVDFVRFLQELAAERTGKLVLTSGEIDTSTATGLLQLRVLLSFAQFYPERLSEKIKEVHALKKARGEHSGSFPFGTINLNAGRLNTPQVLALDPEKGPVLREIVDRSIAGQSCHHIAAWLNGSGLRGPRGGAWHVQNLTGLLRHPLVHRALELNETEIKAAAPRRMGRPSHDRGSALVHNLAVNELAVYAPHMPLAGEHPRMVLHSGGARSRSHHYRPAMADRRAPGVPSFIRLDCPGEAALTYPAARVDALMVNVLTEIGRLDNLRLLAEEAARAEKSEQAQQRSRRQQHGSLLTTARQRLSRQLHLVDKALEAGLGQRAQELDSEARAMRVEVARLETESAQAALPVIEFTPAADALARLELIPALLEQQAWPELRELTAALIDSVRCRFWRYPPKLELHGEAKIIWKPVIRELISGTGKVPSWLRLATS